MTPQKIFKDLVKKAKNDAFAAELLTANLLDDPIEKIRLTTTASAYLLSMQYIGLYKIFPKKVVDDLVDQTIGVLREIKATKGRVDGE
jgi:hypothetical protein